MMHLELFFCIWCLEEAQFHSLACEHSIVPTPFTEKTCLSIFKSETLKD